MVEHIPLAAHKASFLNTIDKININQLEALDINFNIDVLVGEFNNNKAQQDDFINLINKKGDSIKLLTLTHLIDRALQKASVLIFAPNERGEYVRVYQKLFKQGNTLIYIEITKYKNDKIEISDLFSKIIKA